jgi:hypothetical protein
MPLKPDLNDRIAARHHRATPLAMHVARALQVAGVGGLSYGILHFCSGITANLVTASNRPTTVVPEPLEYDTMTIYYEQCHCANVLASNRSGAPGACPAMFSAVALFGPSYVDLISKILIAATVAAAIDIAFLRTAQTPWPKRLAFLLRLGMVFGVLYSAWINMQVVEHLNNVWSTVCPAGQNIIDFGATPTTRYFTRIGQAVVHLVLALLVAYVFLFGSRRPAGLVFALAAVIIVWDNVAAELPDYFEIPGGLVKHLKGKSFAPGFKGEYVGLFHVCDCKPFVCEDERSSLFTIKLLLGFAALAMGATLIAAGYEISRSRARVVGKLTTFCGAAALFAGAVGWQQFRDWFMPPGNLAHCPAGSAFLNPHQFAWGYYLMGIPGLYWFGAGLAVLAFGAMLARRPSH